MVNCQLYAYNDKVEHNKTTRASKYLRFHGGACSSLVVKYFTFCLENSYLA